MRKVGSSVQRIDIPEKLARQLRTRTFLPDDTVGGEMFTDALDDQLFRSAIGLGDYIDRAYALLFGFDAAGKILHEQSASPAGNFSCGRDVVWVLPGHERTRRPLSSEM
jgi:hypothetical protein